jgi:hypothetical protein
MLYLPPPNAGMPDVSLGSLCAQITAASSPEVDIDLEGGTCGGCLPDGTKVITITTQVVIRNGTIELPDGCRIIVEAGGSLQLQDIQLKVSSDIMTHLDEQTRISAYITVMGKQAFAKLYRVTMSDRDLSYVSSAVQVVEGGCINLAQTTLQVRAEYGLHVEGLGSARVLESRISNCQSAGFYASMYGSITAHASTASDNPGCGFLADRCGYINATGCKASKNGLDGFTARADGTLMQLSGPGCISEHNGRSGYTADEGGRVVVGPDSVARDNGHHGFKACGAGSHLTAGPKCSSTSNKISGFGAVCGGQLAAMRGAKASKNRQEGFCSEGFSSQLQAGGYCTSHSNGYGFRAAKGGRMDVGECCFARGNTTCGFASQEAGSMLQIGADCRTENNKMGGFVWFQGGQLTAGQHCTEGERGGQAPKIPQQAASVSNSRAVATQTTDSCTLGASVQHDEQQLHLQASPGSLQDVKQPASAKAGLGAVQHAGEVLRDVTNTAHLSGTAVNIASPPAGDTQLQEGTDAGAHPHHPRKHSDRHVATAGLPGSGEGVELEEPASEACREGDAGALPQPPVHAAAAARATQSPRDAGIGFQGPPAPEQSTQPTSCSPPAAPDSGTQPEPAPADDGQRQPPASSSSQPCHHTQQPCPASAADVNAEQLGVQGPHDSQACTSASPDHPAALEPAGPSDAPAPDQVRQPPALLGFISALSLSVPWG